MKKTTFFLGIFFFGMLGCEKDDFVCSYPELDKLLVSITRIQGDFETRTEFKYDDSNRLVETKNIYDEGDPVAESYTYNDAGHMIEKIAGNHTITYSYNSSGQVTEQNVHYISSYDGDEWDQKTEFKYKNGKIERGIEYSREGEIQNNIIYKYDSRGNLLKKNIISADKDANNYAVNIEFRYDTNVNPLAGSGVYSIDGCNFAQFPDVKQINNPVYISYINPLMNCLPPEYNISYDYNLDGLPVKAKMTSVRYSEQVPIIIEYKYRDKVVHLIKSSE